MGLRKFRASSSFEYSLSAKHRAKRGATLLTISWWCHIREFLDDLGQDSKDMKYDLWLINSLRQTLPVFWSWSTKSLPPRPETLSVFKSHNLHSRGYFFIHKVMLFKLTFFFSPIFYQVVNVFDHIGVHCMDEVSQNCDFLWLNIENCIGPL